MNNRDVRKKQIRDLVNQFYNQYEVLHRDTESELYNKALIRYLDSDMTIEEINADMQNIVSERLELQNDNEEKQLKEKQEEISRFIEVLAIQFPDVPRETVEKLKTSYYKDKRDLSQIKEAILAQAKEHMNAKAHELNVEQRTNSIKASLPVKNEDQDYIIYYLGEDNKPIIQAAKIDSVERTKHGVHDTMKIIVNDGEFIGYLKSLETSRQNSYEIVMSSIGNKLGIPVAQSYRVIRDSKEIAIISKEVSNGLQEELMVFDDWDVSVIQRINNLGIDITPLLAMRKEQFNSPMDINGIKNIIDYNLVVMHAGLSKEEFVKARKQFLESIVFDYLVNQVDRNSGNYEIIVDKVSGEGIRLAPLFDNSAVAKPGLNADETTFCKTNINRHQLLECVYQYYYNDIKDFSERLVENKEEYGLFISQISNEYLDYYESTSFKAKVEQNYHTIITLEQQKKVEQKENQSMNLAESSEQVSFEQEGSKLVRKLPKKGNDTEEGKINLTLLTILALILFFVALMGLYLIIR